VDRARQCRAIACHQSQCDDNPVLDQRLTLLGDAESLRWLRRTQSDAASRTTPTADAPGQSPGGPTAVAEEWDRRYASTDRLFRVEPDETLVEVVTPLRPGRAVDLGAGEGRNSLWLAAHGWAVTAVDLSRQALDRLDGHAHAEGSAVVTIADDLASYLGAARARGDMFDLVVLAYVHPHRAERAELLHAAVSVVGPGGHLFVVGHHRFSQGVAGRARTGGPAARKALRQQRRRRTGHRPCPVGPPPRGPAQANIMSFRWTSSR
jgi:2-polyprenyl-3-methyl-5-hydroxy-6-metoxy-1,4-benzoquinol methylase